MTDVKPWSVTHRGTVAASGFFFAFDITREDEAKSRILSTWEPNTRVFRFKKGLLSVFPKPVLATVNEAIGLPLVRARGFLTAAPLTEKEMSVILPPFESMVIAYGGTTFVEQLADSVSEAPHQWIDTEGLEFIPGTSLGTDSSRPIVVAQAEPPNIRKTLGRFPDPPSEQSMLLARLKGDTSAVKHSNWGWLHGISMRSVGVTVRSLLAGIRSFWRGNSYESQSLTGSKQSVFATRPPTRVTLWLNSVIKRIVMVTRLSRALGWRQGRYLSRVMEMFEHGDVNEALHHAIPLSSISDSPVLKTSFGLPGIRQNLRLNPFGRRPGSTMMLGQSLYSHLHQLYRSTFRHLETQGRIEDAAFVLAELLRSNEEAVAFLERHGKLREAAEIAEARELAPEIVVRQWFIAGEKERAVHVARKTGTFQGAVLRLEKSRHPAAPALRKLWAQSLADAGNMAAAVDVLWPLESERPHAVDWMKRAVEIGGRSGARSLARLISLMRSEYKESRLKAFELLQIESLEGAPARMEFAETLRKEPKCLETQTLARLAARALLRDVGQGLRTLGHVPLRQLIDYSGDGALRADVPPRSAARRVELNDLSTPRRHIIAGTDRGATQISEAVLLPNGTYALALGEVGIRLITRDGRTIAHFDCPADRIVVSENGNRIIALARRGEVWCLSKVDVQSRRATPWRHAEITRFTTNFDGASWFIVCGEDLYVIDATSNHFDAMWRIPDLGNFAGSLTLTSTQLDFVTFKEKNFWLWEYQLPQMRLKSKTILPFSAPLETVREVRLVSCCESGVLDCSTTLDLTDVIRSGAETAGGAAQILFRKINGIWADFLELGADEHVLTDPVIAPNWAAICLGSNKLTRILIYSYGRGTRPVLRIEIAIEGRCSPRVRFDSSRLTIADELGRLHAYELTYGEQVCAMNL
jgi:hypothetical protein